MSRSSVALVRQPREPLGEATASIGNAPRVLIIEDERIVACDLQRLLRHLGYDAYAYAPTASRALALAAETPPDVVLADVRIEGPVDGIDAAFQLRKRYGAAVVFLTAHTDDPTVERAKHAEPCGYLVKPVSAPAVKAVIELALDRLAKEASMRVVEQALAETTSDLLTALNHLPLAIFLEDSQGRILHVNPAFCSLFDLTDGHIGFIGMPGRLLMQHIESLCADPEHFRAMTHALARVQPYMSREAIQLLDGRKLELKRVPILRGDQRHGQLWTCRDITSIGCLREEYPESETH